MIEIERIVPAPPMQEVAPPEPLPINEDQARFFFRNKIRGYAGRIPQGSFALGLQQPSVELFAIDEDGGYINTENPHHPGYKMQGGDLQRIGLEAMREFGLDIGSQPIEVSITPHDNGTIREQTRYASEAVRGLSFDRWLDYVADTKEPVSVRWELTDRHEMVDRELVEKVRMSPPVVELTRRLPGIKEGLKQGWQRAKDEVLNGGVIKN